MSNLLLRCRTFVNMPDDPGTDKFELAVAVLSSAGDHDPSYDRPRTPAHR